MEVPCDLRWFCFPSIELRSIGREPDTTPSPNSGVLMLLSCLRDLWQPCISVLRKRKCQATVKRPPGCEQKRAWPINWSVSRFSPLAGRDRKDQSSPNSLAAVCQQLWVDPTYDAETGLPASQERAWESCLPAW